MSVLAIIKPYKPAAEGSTLSNSPNLYTADPKEVGIALTGLSSAVIEIDLGSIKPVSAVYVGAQSHSRFFDITGGASSYNSDFIGSPTVANKLSGVAPFKNLVVLTTPLNLRYIRLNLYDVAIGSTIGNVIVGKAFRPTWGHEYGEGRGVGDTGSATRLLSGGFGINPGARFKTWDFTLGDLTDAEVEELYDIALSVGTTNPIVVCENPDLTDNLDARIHYGLFSKLDRFDRLIPGATKWNLKVEEWV